MDKLESRSIKSAADEGKIYALETNSLQVGDIVLISQKGLTSWAIRTGTRSKVSHAAVLTRPGILLEAQPEGVRRRSTLGTFATKRKWITVLRPTFQVARNAQGISLAYCAETRYGWAYSKIRAIGSPWPQLSELVGWVDGTFCSELVALAYADYGVDLLPGLQRSAITPGKLKKSKLLTDVTDSCIRILHPIQNVDAYNMAIRIDVRDEPKQDMELERSCFAKIRASQSIPPEVRSLHGSFEWLASLDMKTQGDAEIDAQILKILEREGYLKFYEDQALQLGLGTKPFSDAIKVARKLKATSFTAETNAFLLDLQSMLPAFEEHFNARVDSCNRSQQLAKSASKTLARVLEVQEKMLVQATVLRRDRRGLVAELEAAAKR